MDIESKYYDITSEIDARAILRYLNELGIKNVNGEMLKHFITDLKKYIKYDLNKKYSRNEEFMNEWPERLHTATTFSSRLRSKTHPNTPCSRHKDKIRICDRNVHSAPVLNSNNIEKPPRRACSCVPAELKNCQDQNIDKKRKTVMSNNLIKVPQIKPAQKKSDPVSLYHYYLSMWEKYKSNVPGENKWSDLRWNVRQKMAGCIEPTNVKKVTGKKRSDFRT